MTIATLIAAGRLDERLLVAALERLPGSHISRWVERGHAVDIECNSNRAEVRAAYEGWEGMDVIAHPPGPREKKLLVADMDSTMIGQECIDELADYAGVKPQVADITERAMRGELDFAHALMERVSLLKGLNVGVIEQCLAERITPSPGAKTLVQTMRQRGATTILVSGGFTSFVAPIAREIGFDRHDANVLMIADGELAGTVSDRIVDSRIKRETLVEAREELGLPEIATLAIGDGANDIPMIEEAGLGVAYKAKPALAAVADARLDHHGLDALLWVQGIPRSEWIET